MSRRTFSSPIFFLVRLTMTDPNPMPPQQPAVRVASQQVCVFFYPLRDKREGNIASRLFCHVSLTNVPQQQSRAKDIHFGV
jgi:hypothetical protein